MILVTPVLCNQLWLIIKTLKPEHLWSISTRISQHLSCILFFPKFKVVNLYSTNLAKLSHIFIIFSSPSKFPYKFKSSKLHFESCKKFIKFWISFFPMWFSLKSIVLNLYAKFLFSFKALNNLDTPNELSRLPLNSNEVKWSEYLNELDNAYI